MNSNRLFVCCNLWFSSKQAVGDIFLSAWVFTSGDKLTITFLKIRWEEVLAREVWYVREIVSIHCIVKGESDVVVNRLKSQCYNEPFLCSGVDYSVKWATKTYPMASLTPPCKPVKSRGALVPTLSPDGRLLAVALNQRDPRVSPSSSVSVTTIVIATLTRAAWLGPKI